MVCDYEKTLRIHLDSADTENIYLKGCWCSENEQSNKINLNTFLNSDIKSIISKSKSFICKSDKDVCNLSREVDFTKINSVECSLSVACNSMCPICRDRIICPPFDELQFKILNKIKNLSLDTFIPFTACEPFLYKNQLFNFLKSLTTEDTKSVLLITNATLIEKEDIKILLDIQSKTNIKINIIVSCDEVTQNGYIKTRYLDKWPKVYNNILALNEAKLLEAVGITFSKLNINRAFSIVRFWKQKNIKIKTHIVYITHFKKSLSLSNDDINFLKKLKLLTNKF